MTHPNHPSVDQSDRVVPYNLRQSGRTPTELLISTRVRKSPFWLKSRGLQMVYHRYEKTT